MMEKIEKPNRFTATPVQILAYLRQEFCEDRLERFLWAVGDAAVDEAAEDATARLPRYSLSGPREAGYLAATKEIKENKHYPVRPLPFEEAARDA